MSIPTSNLKHLKSNSPLLTSSWSFKEDTDLYTITDVLAHALQQVDNRLEGPKTGNETYRNIQSLERLLANPEYSAITSMLDGMASKLYLKIQEQFSTLKSELATQVETLAARIRIERDKYLQEAKIDSLLGTDIQPKPFQRFTWVNFSQLGTASYIFNRLTALTKLPVEKLASTTLPYISSKWAINLHSKPQFSTRDIERSYRASKPEMSLDEYMDLVKIYTDNYSYRTLLTQVRNSWNSKNITETVKSFSGLLPKLIAVHNAVTKLASDVLPREALSNFEKNLESMELLLLSLSYYGEFCRTQVYSTSVIMDADTINEEVFEEVEDGEEESTEEEIMKYVRVHHLYKSVPVPFSGVTLARINSVKDYTHTKLNEYVAKTSSKMRDYKAKATSRAMERVMTDMIHQRFTSRDQITKYRGMLPKYLSMVNDPDASLEDALYKYFIDTDHSKTALGKIFEAYSNGISSNITGNESNSDVVISQNLQNDIERDITIQLCSGFLNTLIGK